MHNRRTPGPDDVSGASNSVPVGVGLRGQVTRAHRLDEAVEEVSTALVSLIVQAIVSIEYCSRKRTK